MEEEEKKEEEEIFVIFVFVLGEVGLAERRKAWQPRTNAFLRVYREKALAQAKAMDAELSAGRRRGPLHGVPIAVKDHSNTEGVATASGLEIHRCYLPSRDSTVVARLKQAGAVILGKLQMTEGAYGAHHPNIPAPLNPWNAAYWTGSSSSGSGAATAAASSGAPVFLVACHAMAACPWPA